MVPEDCSLPVFHGHVPYVPKVEYMLSIRVLPVVGHTAVFSHGAWSDCFDWVTTPGPWNGYEAFPRTAAT